MKITYKDRWHLAHADYDKPHRCPKCWGVRGPSIGRHLLTRWFQFGQCKMCKVWWWYGWTGRDFL